MKEGEGGRREGRREGQRERGRGEALETLPFHLCNTQFKSNLRASVPREICGGRGALR